MTNGNGSFESVRALATAIGRSHTDSRFKLWIHIASLKTSNIPFAWFLVLGCNRQAQRTGGYVLSREVRLFVFPFPHRHEKEHPNTRFAQTLNFLEGKTTPTLLSFPFFWQCWLFGCFSFLPRNWKVFERSAPAVRAVGSLLESSVYRLLTWSLTLCFIFRDQGRRHTIN